MLYKTAPATILATSCELMDRVLVIPKVRIKKEDTAKDNKIIAKITEEIV